MASEITCRTWSKIAAERGGGGRAGCPEQRLNSSENWFLQLPRRPALWQETHCSEAGWARTGHGDCLKKWWPRRGLWASAPQTSWLVCQRATLFTSHPGKLLCFPRNFARSFSQLAVPSGCPHLLFLNNQGSDYTYQCQHFSTYQMPFPFFWGFKVKYKHQLRRALQKRCAQEEVRANRSLFYSS